MNSADSLAKLRKLLEELGVRVVGESDQDGAAGFPLAIPLKGGATLVLDLPEPAMLGSLDPDDVGAAVLDTLGRAKKVWGLARKVKYFSPSHSALTTEIGALLESAYDGMSGSLYLDGYRYYASGVSVGGPREVFVLVINSHEERVAKRMASKSSREASALKRLGRVFTMNSELQTLCVSAVHEIASAWELAAVLLWTLDRDTNTLTLGASTGANRQGISVLNRISLSGGSSCLAELVAGSMQPAFLPNAQDHLLTEELEARFCYLKAGGVSVHPLVIGSNLLGVVEMIGREGDPFFGEAHELFQTISEHFALAVNSAVMFENFERMAGHDPLTGIANHRTLHEFLRSRVAEAQRAKQEIGAIMLDVDHFRSFNEEEGHETGDHVLRQVADTMKGIVREYDLAARYGGEEFAAILPNASKETTLAIADRIRKKVSSIPIVTRIGRVRHVTASLGCAVYPECGEDGTSLLRAADRALYEAKHSGRNQVVYFDRSMLEEHREEIVDLESFWSWVPTSRRKKVADRLAGLEPHFRSLGRALGLSRTQNAILRAILIVKEVYEKAREMNDRQRLKQFDRSEAFRLVLPGLQGLHERFDGKGKYGMAGNMIPLLSRVLCAVLAMKEEGPSILLNDPGRFDPEIVALIAELEEAA